MEKDYPQPHAIVGPPYVGKWGVLSYYFVPGGLMHKEDSQRYMFESGREQLYQCVHEEAGLVIVRNNIGRQYRVNPSRFIWVEPPAFALGEKVRTTVGSKRQGWIAVRNWHFKRRCIYFQIEIETKNGRKLHSRWYWEHEIQRHASVKEE